VTALGRAVEVERLASLVGGEWRRSECEDWHPHLNPSDERDVVALVPEGTADDVAAAVSAAAAAVGPWSALTGPARAEHLHRWAAAIGDRQEALAQAMAREVGKPIGEARGEVARCITILRYYAGEAVRDIGEVIPAQVPGALQFTLREPLGVVALITPWNFPLAIPLWKAAPALAFGNVVVLKPSEMASRMAMLLGETAIAAGLPGGVFNILLGRGAMGAALITAPDVQGVSFTGSGRVGAEVASAAATRNIPHQTEMGGKNVAIVLRDADLARAASLTAAGAMRYAGQKCTATSRVVIAREVECEFLAELRRHVEALPVGPVTDANTAIGPVITDRARASIRHVLDEARAESVYSGTVPESAELSHGYFMAPMILRNVATDSALAQRELFGPVLAAFTADDPRHAIAIANATAYGLSATLFTRDLRAALTYVHEIEAGLVRVNGDTTGVDPHAPFGGMKGSSSGTREQGRAAREFYTRTKTVQINP
jgi:aldehyde dehydrogenase (NAD+)